MRSIRTHRPVQQPNTCRQRHLSTTQCQLRWPCAPPCAAMRRAHAHLLPSSSSPESAAPRIYDAAIAAVAAVAAWPSALRLSRNRTARSRALDCALRALLAAAARGRPRPGSPGRWPGRGSTQGRGPRGGRARAGVGERTGGDAARGPVRLDNAPPLLLWLGGLWPAVASCGIQAALGPPGRGVSRCCAAAWLRHCAAPPQAAAGQHAGSRGLRGTGWVWLGTGPEACAPIGKGRASPRSRLRHLSGLSVRPEPKATDRHRHGSLGRIEKA